MSGERGRNRRHHRRIEMCGSVRLVIDTPSGLVTTAGWLIDLSQGGCAVRITRPVDADHAARIQIEVAGLSVWFPVVVRWARSGSRGWTVGCEFDRPTPEKRDVLRRLIWSRENVRVS